MEQFIPIDTAEQLLRGYPAGAEIAVDYTPPEYSASELRDRQSELNGSPSSVSRELKVRDEQRIGQFRRILSLEEAAQGMGVDRSALGGAISVLKRAFGVPGVIVADYGPLQRRKNGQTVSGAVFIPGIWVNDYNGDDSVRSSIFRWHEFDDFVRSPGLGLAHMQTSLEQRGGSVSLSGRAPFRKETMGEPVDPAGDTVGDAESPGSNIPRDLDKLKKGELIELGKNMTPPLDLSSHDRNDELVAQIEQAVKDGAMLPDPTPAE